ncbi:MAG: hypothetical protein LBR83_10600, partial [Clostridiales bacterium]|nr:hypothetical protein [Clostridiales bacterium]
MNDVFKEQIVKRKATTADMAKKVGLVVAVIAVFFIASSIQVLFQFALYITVAAAFGAYVLMGRLNLEYEYIYTNGELDIDV